MSRQVARESVMKLLFETEFNIDFDAESTMEMMKPLDLTKNDRAFLEELREGVLAHLDDVDPIIAANVKGWSFERLAKVDKSILRLAIYEMLFMGTPAAIAVNEAVSMARIFSSEESASFINGLLGTVSRQALSAEEEAE